MGTGQKLWKRDKQLIPGGNMLLSKRPEMFLPDQWPAYFSKAKGCKVWDLDGNEYIDMSIMGIGTNILGYGNPEVDDAVRKTIDAGNMSTLNCPEEERWLGLLGQVLGFHKWSPCRLRLSTVPPPALYRGRRAARWITKFASRCLINRLVVEVCHIRRESAQ